MKKLILCIVCTMLPLFGADESVKNTNEFFEDTVDNITEKNKEYSCASKSKDGKYTTEIIGYDFENGIVECRVRSEDDTYETYRSFNANKQFLKKSFSYLKEENIKNINKLIEEQNNPSLIDKAISAISALTENKSGTSETSEKIQPEISVDTDKVNLSHYLASLATLQNIKPEQTAGTTLNYDFKLNIDDLDTKVDFVIAQAMNQANIEYFRELYYGMNEIYIHLQNLLFIVVGGFFLATLGGQKIQKYLENRGQSTGQKEPYLHKFFIPLLCAGVFYMPITESGGVNSTIIQNIIRYFTNEATTIADKASRIGLAKYTKKFDKEHNIRMQIEKPEQIIIDKQKLLYLNIDVDFLPTITKELQKCKTQYSNDEKIKFFDEIDKRWLVQSAKKELDSSWTDAISSGFIKLWNTIFASKENKYPTISLEACKYLATEHARYSTALEILKQRKKTATTFKDTIKDSIEDSKKENAKKENKDRLENTSEKVFKILNNNETEYGWLNSLIAPASVMLLSLQRDAKVTLEFNSKEDITKLLDDKKIAVMETLGEKADEDTITGKAINFILDKVVVFMLPGSQSIFKTIVDSNSRVLKAAATGYVIYNLRQRGGTEIEVIFATVLLGWGGASSDATATFTSGVSKGIKGVLGKDNLLAHILSLPFDATSSVASSINNLLTIYLGLATVYFLYMDILEKLPLIITSMAGILAFITYFVSLCKYYYISPFVVAFALTTKRVDKIINFLMIGITIFFKPVLIVLFIYLALFLHGIVYELFIITSVSQFNSIMASSDENSINFGTQLTIGVIKTLLQLFGSLGSCYIVWKTIMTGPDWVFKMLGLETSATSEATQQLAGKLEQKAVVI